MWLLKMLEDPAFKPMAEAELSNVALLKLAGGALLSIHCGTWCQTLSIHQESSR